MYCNIYIYIFDTHTHTHTSVIRTKTTHISIDRYIDMYTVYSNTHFNTNTTLIPPGGFTVLLLVRCFSLYQSQKTHHLHLTNKTSILQNLV